MTNIHKGGKSIIITVLKRKKNPVNTSQTKNHTIYQNKHKGKMPISI